MIICGSNLEPQAGMMNYGPSSARSLKMTVANPWTEIATCFFFFCHSPPHLPLLASWSQSSPAQLVYPLVEPSPQSPSLPSSPALPPWPTTPPPRTSSAVQPGTRQIPLHLCCPPRLPSCLQTPHNLPPDSSLQGVGAAYPPLLDSFSTHCSSLQASCTSGQ